MLLIMLIRDSVVSPHWAAKIHPLDFQLPGSDSDSGSAAANLAESLFVQQKKSLRKCRGTKKNEQRSTKNGHGWWFEIFFFGISAPKIGEDEPIFDSYVSNGWKPPTRGEIYVAKEFAILRRSSGPNIENRYVSYYRIVSDNSTSSVSFGGNLKDHD